MCFRVLDDESKAKVTKYTEAGQHDQAWSCISGRVVPHIMMSQRNIKRDQWTVHNKDGTKPYVSCASSPINDQLGYNTARDGHLVAVSFALGMPNEVASVGCDVRRIHAPHNVPVSIYVESLSHKLTDLERSFLASDDTEVVLRRLFILWTLKESYLKALGQPLHLGIAWDRIECDIPNEVIRVDGVKLGGWEFRMFKASITVDARGSKKAKDEVYQVTCAIHRGGTATTFVWNQESAVLQSWLRFVTVESLLDGVRRLPYAEP